MRSHVRVRSHVPTLSALTLSRSHALCRSHTLLMALIASKARWPDLSFVCMAPTIRTNACSVTTGELQIKLLSGIVPGVDGKSHSLPSGHPMRVACRPSRATFTYAFESPLPSPPTTSLSSRSQQTHTVD